MFVALIAPSSIVDSLIMHSNLDPPVGRVQLKKLSLRIHRLQLAGSRRREYASTAALFNYLMIFVISSQYHSANRELGCEVTSYVSCLDSIHICHWYC